MYGIVLVFAFILVSLELNKAKADEKSITLSEFKEAIVVVHGKVSEFEARRVSGKKQKNIKLKVWADMKAQFVSTKNKLSFLLRKTNAQY